ncbi:MAG: hypothetical protein IPJ81_14450 [Chitinophagaceae bacterium]|nr:hypothetical protein [Chitinophagaceae bacterium]
MKGEKVDIDSIKNSVMEEMKGIRQRTEKFGKEAAAYAQEKGKAMGNELGSVANRTGRSLGDIIALLFKIFAYFIVGCMAFTVFMSLIGLGIVSIGFMPLKDFIIRNNTQDLLVWGTLIFFIAVPIIGVLTWLIRRLTKVKSNSKLIRASFICMWIVGWACISMLGASVGKDFRHANENLTEQEIILSNPAINKLLITSQSPMNKYVRGRWFKLEPFSGIDEDTAYIKNYKIEIVKSLNDSFRVTIIKMADGRTRAIAQETADRIEFDGTQKDTVLQLDRGIAINKTDKFRNQRILIRIYVPVGKQIRIDGSMEGYNRIHTLFSDGNIDIDFNDEEQGWDTDVDYVMKADGLFTLDGKPAKESNKNCKRQGIRIDNNGMEINDGTERVKIDKNGINITSGEPDNEDKKERIIDSIETKQQREKDSLEEKHEREKEKILNSVPNAILIPVSFPGLIQ